MNCKPGDLAVVVRGTPTTWGKFYTIHLQDATPEDRKVIERHLGIHFEFNGDSVSWFPYSE